MHHEPHLERNARHVLSAAPLADAESGAPAGGLWLVEADSPQDVRALVESDPFWPTGLRSAVRILAWSQVFAEGRRLNAAATRPAGDAGSKPPA